MTFFCLLLPPCCPTFCSFCMAITSNSSSFFFIVVLFFFIPLSVSRVLLLSPMGNVIQAGLSGAFHHLFLVVDVDRLSGRNVPLNSQTNE